MSAEPWIRLTRSGDPLWFNPAHVEYVKAVEGGSQVGTRSNCYRVDQSPDEVHGLLTRTQTSAPDVCAEDLQDKLTESDQLLAATRAELLRVTAAEARAVEEIARLKARDPVGDNTESADGGVFISGLGWCTFDDIRERYRFQAVVQSRLGLSPESPGRACENAEAKIDYLNGRLDAAEAQRTVIRHLTELLDRHKVPAFNHLPDGILARLGYLDIWLGRVTYDKPIVGLSGDSEKHAQELRDLRSQIKKLELQVLQLENGK